MRMSIVTLSHNQAEFLETAMLSVLDQDHPDIEYILVDPGSTDGSRAIIERHRHRLGHVILDLDDGPADGLRRGLAAATGSLFGFLNADDRLLPGAVTRAVRAFAGNPEAAVVYGHGIIEDHRIGRRYTAHASRPPLTPWLLAFGGISLVQQSMFFRTDAVRAAGGFTAPTTIGIEKATNPFLRAGDPGIRRHLGMETASDAEVFAEIRGRKDRF